MIKSVVLLTSLAGFCAWSWVAVAAVTYQNAGPAVSGTGAVTPAWPAHAVNDIALLFVESAGGEAVTLSSNAAGFAQVAGSPQATGTGTAGTRMTVFWARATTAAMAAPTVADPGNHVYARIITYRGAVITGNPWNVTGGGVKVTASSSVTVSGITTTVPNTLVVQAVSRDNDRTGTAFSAETNANLSGIAERQDGGTASGNGGGFAVWDGSKATAGATGNTTASINRSTTNAFLSIALMPDITPPTVTSITRAGANPTGAASVSWTVVFSEYVTGVDPGDFALVQAGGVSGASITSVTGSGTIWTVTASTGSNSGTLGLNLADNDTIIDAAGNRLGGTGAGNGNFTGEIYIIDKTNPYVNSINRANSDPTNAASVSWTVVFSESVTGVDTGDFSLVQAGGVSGASITSVTGSGTTWTVIANTGSNSGTLGLDLIDNDTIIDLASRPLGGSGAGNANFTGQIYTVDKDIPLVLSINRADADPSTADAVSWIVLFSKSVTGVDVGDFALAASGLSGAYITAVSGAGTTWTVVANTGICTGSCTLGLNLVDNDSITGPSGNQLGGTGAGNGNFTGEVYSIDSTPPFAGYSMDEALWNGTTDEVGDSYGGGGDGTAYYNATITSGDTGSCRYGVFDNGGTITRGVVLLPNFPDQTDDFTITAWIRTTNNTIAGQRILIDDESNTGGYGLSLGDGGTGRLRFYARGSAPASLDTANVIANNTWYFVAAVVDINNLQRRLYVFNAAGSLVSSVSDSFTGWGTDDGDASIGGETAASSEATASFHFRGNLDEVRVYGKVLTQSALTTLASQTHACASAGPNHYELSMPTAGISCLSTTATVTACADAGSPCINKYTGASGTTATLSATGATLAATTVTFDATGVATTTLSYPAATDGATATLTLAGVTTAAGNLHQCCPNGVSCVLANSCSTIFNTAGFIVSAAADDVVASIPAQVAGITSGTYYLRAVKTSTTTKACESALSGTNTVNFAYECNNPTTCYGANLLSVNGGTATTIARNNNGSVSSYTSVDMTFDANGNAPFIFNYNDVGQVKLHVNKAASGALLTSLSGASNAFVVAPHHFGFSGITAGPIKAGNNFSATLTAYNGLATPTATPSFGRETTPESVTLTSTLVTPDPVVHPTASNPALGNNVIAGTEFGAGGMVSDAAGVATANNLNWGEAGSITLTANLTSGSYLGSTLNATGTSATVGAFIPDHLDTEVLPTLSVPMPCPGGLTCPDLYDGFVYSGQPFSIRLYARNFSGGTTANYHNAFGLSHDVTLSAWDALGSSTTENPGTGVLTNNTIAATAFNAGISTSATPFYTFDTSPTTPTNIFVRAVDTVNAAVTSLRATPASSIEGGVKVVSGRIKVSNAYGSELLPLTLIATAQYFTAAGWVNSVTDSITHLTLTASYSVGTGTTAVTLTPVSSDLSGGKLTIKLGKPSVGAGVATIKPTAPTYLPVTQGTATFGVYKGRNDFIYQRERY